MIISDSAITASSQSSHQKTIAQSTKIVSAGTQSSTILDSRQESFDQVIFTASQSSSSSFSVTSSAEKNREESSLAGKLRKANSTENVNGTVPGSPLELKQQLIQRLMEALTGKQFKATNINLTQQFINNGSSLGIRFGFQSLNANGGASIISEIAQTETESVSYSAAGVVKTADGKSINIGISMSMSRSTASYLQTTIGLIPAQQNSKAIDPLIINYAGTAASLTDEKYDFDLDADGKKDSISFAGAGSGFLALDKNGDGIINDGSELFGPQSGNGFEELRKYDSDGNGWIDEADEIYSRLKVWCKDKNGNDVLYSLKELDIGAIYLNESQTDYGMYDSSGNMQGAMRSTSFFLKDSGGAGFVSHFDLLA